jgi:N-methylhydantoinase A
MTSRVAVDVGGTFTDAVMLDERTGRISRAKVLTDPVDQSLGTVSAIRALAPNPRSVSDFSHGYTVGLNAALTRRGAKTGMLSTAGHRDTVDTGRAWRPFDDRLYDPTWLRPHEARPIVERRHRRDIPERLSADGTVLLELDEAGVRREVEFLKSEGVESVGICLINGYEHRVHEERIRQIVNDVIPDAYVQTSEIWPLAREFERSFAVMLDAYTGPPVVRYLDQLETRLKAEGFSARVEIMQMDGGLRTSASVRAAPVYTLQSGPVAGLLGAQYYAREFLDNRSLVCLDIGGTSSDIGVIVDGAPEVTNEWELEHAIPLPITTLDVRSIGAGGGSIIKIDDVGSLLVGPESAGSDPGPACYGRGASSPALTDAYVALGLLQPDLFLGGKMKLDVSAARAALAGVGGRIGLEDVAVAEGAYELANTKLAASVSAMTIARGMDPREFSLFSYGAAGPMHAVAVARDLGMREVVVPYYPGGFSAFGMLASRKRVEYSQALMQPLQSIAGPELTRIAEELAERARTDLLDQGVREAEIQIEFAYYAMYHGQGQDNRLALPSPPFSPEVLAEVAASFHRYYDRRFGYRAPEIPIIVTALSAVGFGPQPGLALPTALGERSGGLEAAEQTRADIRLDRRLQHDAPIYDRTRLVPGDELAGPAIIDDQLGTIVLLPESIATVDQHGTLRITASPS